MRTLLFYTITVLPCLTHATKPPPTDTGVISEFFNRMPLDLEKPYHQPFDHAKRPETTWRKLLGPGYRTNRRYETNVKFVRMLFPGYFMTPEEHAMFLARYTDISKSYRTEHPDLWKDGVCADGSTRRKRGTGTMWYHACIQSSLTCKLLQNATNINGEYVELVQLTDLFQYFMEEDMEQIDSCTLCVGDQPEPFIHQAVVWVDRDAPDPIDQMDYDYIITKGCSKCLNV